MESEGVNGEYILYLFIFIYIHIVCVRARSLHPLLISLSPHPSFLPCKTHLPDAQLAALYNRL